MPYNDFVRIVKRNIIDLRTELKALESGQLQCAQRPRGGVWVDTTQNHIRGLKETIATLETVVTHFEKSSDERQKMRLAY